MIHRKDKTVLILKDKLPGYNEEEIEFIKNSVEAAGYVAKFVTVENIMDKNMRVIHFLYGFALVVPNAANLPLEIAEKLDNFSRTAGCVLYIGGPLFYNLVEKVNGEYVNIPIENSLDANYKFGSIFKREGIAPAYKLYSTKNITRIEKSGGQHFFNGQIELDQKRDVVIPCETNNGMGYETEANCRFISLADCYDDVDINDILALGRSDGRRGSFAYIVLEDTRGNGHEGMQHDSGHVTFTSFGSASAQIGVNDIHKIKGADTLIGSILDSFSQGLYLYEGGANGIRFRKDDEIKFGAKVLNVTEKFKTATVKITVQTDSENIEIIEEKLVNPRSYCEYAKVLSYDNMLSYCITPNKDYDITVQLIFGGKVIDEIKSVYSYEEKKQHSPEEFVKVEGNKFTLGGKPWFMAGMNYWSSYFPSRNRPDYWMGMFDKSNYNPKVVEEDLAYMEKLGINCVWTRIDYSGFHRVKHAVRDFLIRCEKHNIRVYIANSTATSSEHFCKAATEEYFSEVNIIDNPTVMCLETEWETASNRFDLMNKAQEFNDEWQEWIISKFGSIQNAEQQLDYTFEKDIYGYICVPKAITKNIGPHYRRFVIENTNKYYKEAFGYLRQLVPNQLITFRTGGDPSHKGHALAAEFIDFTPMEVYSYAMRDVENHKDPDMFEKCVGFLTAASVIHEYETGGKPIVWGEYGRSAGGSGWDKNGSYRYDRDNMCYFEDEIEKQVIFNRFVEQTIEEADCAGAAPWYWCGGFRQVNLEDFGQIAPDGKLNQIGINYIKFCERMKEKIKTPDSREKYTVECNIDDFENGKTDALRTLIPAYFEAKKQGKKLEVITKYKNI